MSSKPPHSFFGSLLVRLTLLYVIVFTAALAGVYVVFAAQLTRTAVEHTDRLILGEAKRMLDLAGRRKPTILQSEIDRFAFHYGTNEVFLVLTEKDGTVLAGSLPSGWTETVAVPSFINNTPPIFMDTLSPTGQKVRTVVLSDEAGNRMQVGALVESMERELGQARHLLAVAMVASILLGTSLAFLLTRRAFSRIERVRATAAAIAHGTAGQRVPSSGESDEVAALSHTFNEMLDRIEKTLDELRHVTDNMAHDLRTPLTRMRAAAESALLASGTPTPQDEVLSSILEECARLERMTGTLLQVARMDSGAYTPATDLCDVTTLIRQAADLMEPAFQDKGIAIHINVPDLPLTVLGDLPVLERVLANLLDNTLKFTPHNGSVRVSGNRRSESIEITISDTGCGISPDELERIFDRFHRSAKTLSVSGFGLGLSFVRAAVQAHGGSVTATSTLGQGSTFTLCLPSHQG